MKGQKFSTRLKIAIDHYGLSNNQLTSYIKASNGYIGKLLSGEHFPSLDKVENILWALPDISADWLIMGVGNMLRADSTFLRSQNENPLIKPTNDPANISKYEKSLVGLEQNQVNDPQSQYQRLGNMEQRQGVVRVPLFDTYAGASPQGYLTQGYIDEKDVISIPAHMLQPGKKYVCFQVKGESMLPTLHDKDYVIAKFIEVTDYQAIKKDCIYAVITQKHDMIIKRIQNHSDGYLLCYPDNIYHATVRVYYEDILQVFEVSARLTLHLEQTPLIENLERIFKNK